MKVHATAAAAFTFSYKPNWLPVTPVGSLRPNHTGETSRFINIFQTVGKTGS